MAAPLLCIQNVVAGYGPIEALKGVSLEVHSGEIVTLIGANGAGKSSTLMCVSGLLRARSGAVHFDGADITGYKPHTIVEEGLAQVPEGRKIFPRLTVLENLELGAYLRRDQQAIKLDIEKVYNLFPILGERRRQLGGTLSGGEQQMLAIGRALMSRPKMLLMDEPSMGVAPILTAKIFATIRELNKEGMTILLVEQNAHLALKTAHRGYVIETGTIVLEEKAELLLKDPRVKEAYLGDDDD
ncbi:MAG: ABC transporter ATP-binding protein [Candidatus Hydrogenedentes bacterium]|nr:ABC transporter ATP-binding protein [Candidatus Hydrogenedentota bacterium]